MSPISTRWWRRSGRGDLEHHRGVLEYFLYVESNPRIGRPSPKLFNVLLGPVKLMNAVRYV